MYVVCILLLLVFLSSVAPFEYHLVCRNPLDTTWDMSFRLDFTRFFSNVPEVGVCADLRPVCWVCNLSSRIGLVSLRLMCIHWIRLRVANCVLSVGLVRF